jgi:hypothetical protein
VVTGTATPAVGAAGGGVSYVECRIPGRCFRCMLQVFHTDVAKVYWDVAYVVMVVHVYCKRLFLVFHLFFQTHVARVFIWMLHMFHTYVASVLLNVAYVCNDFKYF